MKDNNTIFYSTASRGYALYAVTSLLSIRRFIPDAKLAILSFGLSDHEKKILTKNHIELHEIDLTKQFYKTWDYPVECYYMFAGPELFYNLGYLYSVYIDGDVLCGSDPLAKMTAVEYLSGVGVSDGKKIFGDDWATIKKHWNVASTFKNSQRIQSGIVYFNNKKMSQEKLLNVAKRVFRDCVNLGIPRKGDDSLFALLQFLHFDSKKMTFLDLIYNFMPHFNKWKYPVQNLVFFHFTLDKPWKKRPYRHKNRDLDAFDPYVKAWRKILRKTSFIDWLKLTF